MAEFASSRKPFADLSHNAQLWSVEESANLFGLDQWGYPYFSINDKGHVIVCPKGESGGSLDLMALVDEMDGRNVGVPLLIRFDDILEDRLERLHTAFQKAIAQYHYKGNYQGVFPIKCNQQRYVVEELIACGKQWHFGLEAGSKAELLVALSLMDDPKALLICNGYKDQRYIETAILARQLGRSPVVVIEQPDEVDRIISASKLLGAAPLIGIRAKLASRSSGRWGSSVGETSKFGLSIPDILSTVEALRNAHLLDELQLLHFHLGSQINNIAILKDALQEAGQIYVELCALGAPMGYLDVGGGLGIDYDGSRTASSASTNYSLQNYANDVVATIGECCDSNSIDPPTLISESGRAIVSHFSVLVFNILGVGAVSNDIPPVSDDAPLILRNLRDSLRNIESMSDSSSIDPSLLQEVWNDALKFKDDALVAFRLGYLGLADRAKAEQLTWGCARALINRLSGVTSNSKEIIHLRSVLASTYYANFSIFRSAPDTWAIDQLFPVMPIHRLNEKPTQLGHFADLTCDSDGKLSRFINHGQDKTLLELHEFNDHDEYLIGMFLAGAYQEVMGSLHNLFGTTNSVHIRMTNDGGYQVDHVVRANMKSDVLEAMEHDPNQLLERLRVASELAIQRGALKIKDARLLMDHVETSLRQSTYLKR
ncbi:biosynthetic arginine decarboxylase [Prochlorococcus sp. MIT 1341]|uniref:biosynthetic arginine decarboxylase n=1 Tax=Prochlorococcus sp. MIT 1341 TaxID=3096221 RepID=UPI002A76070B|nr:biosynthetic arginine decarboxylase [Prochlorococcus sp. MIT 1341]